VGPAEPGLQLPRWVLAEPGHQLPQWVQAELGHQLPRWVWAEPGHQLPQWVRAEPGHQLPQWVRAEPGHQTVSTAFYTEPIVFGQQLATGVNEQRNLQYKIFSFSNNLPQATNNV